MSDGGHIALLIMAALYHLAPQFLQEGRLCWLKAPLYMCEYKGKRQYFYSDAELNAAKNLKGDITRFKGLGEMSPEVAHESMFTAENQHMVELIPTEESLVLLNELMGPNIEPRKDFVFNNIDFSEIRE